MPQVYLNLYKENFKFSAAHFLIFDASRAERLHGHNYQVQVKVELKSESIVGQGYGIDFNVLKKDIRLKLEELDEYVLLPGRNSEVKITTQDQQLEVHFRDRFYSFPKAEVKILPMSNTSVEGFAAYLAQSWAKSWQSLPILTIQVQVEESSGQSASWQHLIHD